VFTGDQDLRGYDPDENAQHFSAAGALFIADGVVRGPDHSAPIGYVPDSLMDDPVQTKRRLLDAYRRVLDEAEFERLLLAHGGPIIGDGRAQLEEFVQAGGRTTDEL
jgi:hypothetical protein